MRAMADAPTVVLVHGAWHGPWSWDGVVEELRGDDTRVVAIDLPSVVSGGDLYDDAAAVHAAIAATGGPTVVVAHSYGGIPATEGAAGAEGVRHLLYLAAFMLDEGESLLAVVGGVDPDWWRTGSDGTTSVDRAEEIFYNACPPDVARAAAARLRPQTRASFEQPVRAAAWHDIPSTYVICERDNAIPVVAQEAMAARAGTTHRLDSDHSPFLGQPAAVADLIRGVIAH
jgi:pimeloyl-ACP methyl ester carboxylesterase